MLELTDLSTTPPPPPMKDISEGDGPPTAHASAKTTALTPDSAAGISASSAS